MAKTSPAQFVREVRQEMAKVTWPTKKELITTTAMVFVMAILAAVFFLHGRSDHRLGDQIDFGYWRIAWRKWLNWQVRRRRTRTLEPNRAEKLI